MGLKFGSGDRVMIGAGEHAGKRGSVVPRLAIDFTHCRRGSIPHIEGAKEPLGIHDELVRLDNGKIVAVHEDHLTRRADEDYPLTGVA